MQRTGKGLVFVPYSLMDKTKACSAAKSKLVLRPQTVDFAAAPLHQVLLATQSVEAQTSYYFYPRPLLIGYKS